MRQGNVQRLLFGIDNYNVEKDLDRVNTYVILALRKYSANGMLLKDGRGDGANGTFKLPRSIKKSSFERGEESYKCKVCFARFRDISHFREHERKSPVCLKKNHQT